MLVPVIDTNTLAAPVATKLATVKLVFEAVAVVSKDKAPVVDVIAPNVRNGKASVVLVIPKVLAPIMTATPLTMPVVASVEAPERVTCAFTLLVNKLPETRAVVKRRASLLDKNLFLVMNI